MIQFQVKAGLSLVQVRNKLSEALGDTFRTHIHRADGFDTTPNHIELTSFKGVDENNPMIKVFVTSKDITERNTLGTIIKEISK